MNKNEIKRKGIFDKFSNQLQLLKGNGYLKDLKLKYPQTYICPICTRQFSIESLNQKGSNPLTLEDAPPKSLGGTANILTCKECNNDCGSNIDYHLVERMKELDQKSFLPKVEFAATFERNGKSVNGKVRVEENGRIIARHSKKNNNPSILESFIKLISPINIGSKISIKLRTTPVDPYKLQIALLKTGYLLTFSKFGYSFLLDENYNNIRWQLKNPESFEYTNEFWNHIPQFRSLYGTHFITTKGIESVLSVFPLKTKVSERPFATIIELPLHPIVRIAAEINNRTNLQGGLLFEIDPMNGNVDYFSDLHAINKMMAWIELRSK